METATETVGVVAIGLAVGREFRRKRANGIFKLIDPGILDAVNGGADDIGT